MLSSLQEFANKLSLDNLQHSGDIGDNSVTKRTEIDPFTTALNSIFTPSKDSNSEVNASSKEIITPTRDSLNERELQLMDEVKLIREMLRTSDSKLTQKEEEIVLLKSNLERISLTSSSTVCIENETNNPKIQEMNTLLTKKESKIEELEAKIKEITEKMKDVVKRYAESKAKVHSLTQEHAEQINRLQQDSLNSNNQVNSKEKELIESLQSKESELVSLRLKYENSERVIEEQKESLSDSSIKIKELKKELTFSKKSLDDTLLTQNDLTKEIKILQSKNQELTVQNDEFSRNLLALKETLNGVESKNELEISKKNIEIEDLKRDNESMSQRLSKENETTSALEEYKKRAQTALKKANATSAALTSELDVLKSQVSEQKDALANEEILREKLRGEIITLTQELQSKLSLIEELNGNLTVCAANNTNLQQLLASKDQEIEGLNQLRDELMENINKFKFELEALKSISVIDTAPNKQSSVETIAVGVDEFVGNNLISPVQPSEIAVKVIESTVTDTKELNETTVYSSKNNDQYFYITELYNQIEELRREISSRGLQIAQQNEDIMHERDQNKKLNLRIDELVAFLERSKKLTDGPDSAINIEYLKACIYKFMSTNEISEKKRLAPVICTVLKLTPVERKEIDNALAAAAPVSTSDVLSFIWK